MKELNTLDGRDKARVSICKWLDAIQPGVPETNPVYWCGTRLPLATADLQP